MKSMGKRLTYANVMSTLAVFLVLGGATAFAAHRLGRHSVGSKQLKANAVTTVKIKREAVARKKIKKEAVDTTKIADGSVTGADLDLPSTPFSRVTARMRGSSTLPVSTSLQVYSLSPSTYSQGPEEVDSYVGAVDLTFSPSCGAPRSAVAYVLVDPADPLKPEPGSIVASGQIGSSVEGTLVQRLEIGPYPGRFEPGTAKARNVVLVIEGKCAAGGGIVASSGAVDVIGTR